MKQQKVPRVTAAVRSSPWTWMVAIAAVSATSTSAHAQWSQFGGPNRNFTVDAKGLADKWPEEGPRRLWERDLGDGYATIVVDNGVLYTMYRKDADEFTVALDAKTGETIWEHGNPSPFTKLMAEYGPGPHSTPLIVGNRLYTIGTNSVMHCFNKKTGRVLWKHDLVDEFGAPIPGRGYASSPIAYKNTVIVPVDRPRKDQEGQSEGDAEATAETKEPPEAQTLIAFDQETGAVVWKALDFAVSYSSPILITLDGEDQLVFFTAQDLIGVDPDNGALLWSHPFHTQYGANISTPLWNGENLLFCSAAYGSGARVIRLRRDGGKTVTEELWHSRKMRIHHGNVIAVGDYVYGSSGDSGPTFFMGINMRNGKIAWRERGFTKANCVYADGKVIILDEDGQLGLATVTPKGMTVHSRCTVAERYAWAAPTLVGKTLFVRDRKKIMALDLGRSWAAPD